MSHMAPSASAAPADINTAQRFARSMRVYRRQCLFLCASVEKALSSASQAANDPESGQQWDDALSNINERFAEWSNLSIVESFVKSDQISMGVDQLFGELRWCGLQYEETQLAEKRKQDEEVLQDALRTIASDPELLKEILTQPSESIIVFIRKLQNTLLQHLEATSSRAKLEYALMFLYKTAQIRLPTPDITSQISEVESVPTPSSPLFKTYHAEWLDEERVAIRALRLTHYTPANVKRFRRDIAPFYAASRHSNIVRVYGMVLDEGLGCGLVIPTSTTGVNALSFLSRVGNTSVIPWLLDIASAMQHLHAWVPAVICGCLRAENIWIKDDGASVCISDFGLFQLSSDIKDAMNKLLRWCAPETIRAVKNEEGSSSVASICTKRTDVYSFGIIMFGMSFFRVCTRIRADCPGIPLILPEELFTSDLPFHHIQDDETLELEIVHGTRPIISAEHKPSATQRGFSASMHTIMKDCWALEPIKRPSMEMILNRMAWIFNREKLSRPGSETSHHRPESSSGSIMSRSSRSTNSSGRDSALHPLTPRSTGSFAASSNKLSYSSMPGVPSAKLFSTSELFSEPPLIELEQRDAEDHVNDDLSHNLSNTSLKSGPCLSENTIRPEPRSSFSSDQSDEGSSHLGQRENAAYDRMPKLKSTNSTLLKGLNKKRFEILTSPMTTDEHVNPNWVGVSTMEGLRGITRRAGKLTQVSAVESLIRRESQFLSDSTDEYLAHRLRANPGILGIARLENFLSAVLEDSRTLRMVNQHFRNALQSNSNLMATGFAQFSLVCKEAAMQFGLIYPAYIQRLEDVWKVVADELDSNDRFSELMNEKQDDDSTLHQKLDKFLHAPVTHLWQHPRTLQLIKQEMSVDDPERPLLQGAIVEMLKTVNLIRVSEWQQNGSQDSVGWKDFVSKETIGSPSRSDVTRQTLIFEIISEERAYVVKLKMLQKILQNVSWEITSLRRVEDTVLQDIVKLLIAVAADFLRFHSRLLENLFTLQRSQHPFIATIVATGGIDQIPWHSLYDHRFGNAYRRLAGLIQDGKARAGIFKRIMQREQSLCEVDFMQFLRTPSTHLRLFVNSLKKIAELANIQNEDHQVISEIFPRLSEVCHQVEMKTSSSRERARLTSLAGSLDFGNFPGLEVDVDVASSSRTLIMSGNLKLRMTSSQTKRVFLEDRFTLLIDNYLIFTRKSENQGVLRLEVCEKPLALELLATSSDGIPPTSAELALFPCLKLKSNGHDPLYLYAETQNTSSIWRSKIEESRSERMQLVEKTRVIDLEVLHRFARSPSCSAEFRHAGEDIVAMASEQPTPGIWLRHGRNPSLHLSAPLEDVSQITVLEEHGIVLVLAAKSLLWYRQEEFVKGVRTTQRFVDESFTVSFYRIGSLGVHCFLVVSAWKKGRNILRFYEISSTAKSPKLKNAFRNKPGPFTLVAEKEFDNRIADVLFLKSSFVLVGDAFQLVTYVDSRQLKEALSSNKPQLLPLPNDPLAELAERCHSSQPLAIYRVDKDFIVCYKGFAAYVNSNGQLSSKVIEWESSDVQSIVFRPPYMFVIGISTVEIRQIQNGKLMQLLAVPGTVKLAWEKRHEDDSSSDLGIHLIMGTGLDEPPPSHWYSLDNSLPYTLFRVSRR